MRSRLRRDLDFARPVRILRRGLVVRDEVLVDFIQLGISPKTPRPTTTVHRDAVTDPSLENFLHSQRPSITNDRVRL